MRPCNSACRPSLRLLGLVLLTALAGLPAHAQQGGPPRPGGFKLTVDVDLVVVHTTVADKKGRLVTNLDKQHFRVFEDGVEQTLAVFRSEDVPVTVGLVLDNSGSMTENRRPMMAGALRFTAFSNPLDEMFVVNFNDDYYLDLEGRDFTNDVDLLRDALDKTDTRGGTAFYDAIRASLAHLKRGTRQKKALVIISDGVDTTSLSDFNTLLRHVQQEEAALYLIQLPCSPDVERRDCRRAKREIKKLARATGGMAFFPEGLEEVEALCEKIARDIRNQYVLGYYPTNKARDGSFRQVRIEIKAPRGLKGLQARHRPGYYAGSEEAAGSQ